MELSLRLIAHNAPEYQTEIALRYRLLREPLGLSFTAEQLAAEAADTHLGAFLDGELIGCLVLTPLSEGEVQMRQVAVDERFQGRGIGKQLVAFSEEVAKQAGYRRLILHARETAVPFYLKLGYAIVGEPFEEVTVPHREMVKNLREN